MPHTHVVSAYVSQVAQSVTVIDTTSIYLH
jgi:hypothetical protein